MATTQEYLDFILPANSVTLAFLKLSGPEKLQAIELGTKFLKTGHQQLQLWNNDQWVAKLATQAEEKDLCLANTRKQLEEEHAANRDLQERHKTALEAIRRQLKEEISTLYRSECEQLQHTIERLEEKLQKREASGHTFYENTRNAFEQRLTDREDKWEKQLEKMRQDYELKLAAERLEKENYQLRTHNSTIKGQDGEECIHHQLNLRFPKADIEDTHKTKGRGDFILKEGAFGMLIEIKNYTKNVPKHEIGKFYNDMDNNHDIQCGILLSLQSGVSAKDDFQFEVIGGKPILFLHHISKNMEHIELAVQLFKLILKVDSIDLSCKETMGRLERSIPVIKRNWNKMKQKIQTFHKGMTECLLEQEDLVKSMFQLLSLQC